MSRVFVALLLLFAVGCANSGRTPLPPPFSPPPAPVELEEDPLAKYPELLLLPGRIVRVRYSSGALDRAEHFRQRLDGIAEAVAPLVRGELPLVGVVLDREGWEESGIETAWGLPARTGALAYTVGSDGDPDTVALAKALTGGFLPALPGEPLLGSADEGSSQVVADALLQVDVGRGIVEHLELAGTDPWITEILAHLVARLGWEATDPGQMPAIADLFDRMSAASPAAPARSGEPLRLDAYRAGLPLAEDLAWQSHYLRAADLIFVEKGKMGTVRWLKDRIKSRLPVPRADLEDQFPALTTWRQETFAP